MIDLKEAAGFINMNNDSVIIIGAGPAGLAAAYELVKNGICPNVLEKGDMVGGMARTKTYKAYRFDVGGHRFITNIGAVQNLWETILGKDLIKVPRLSSIYYQKRFFRYPLYLSDVLTTLGTIESILILLSYFKSRSWPFREEKSFEQWVSNRFGERLYRTFFKAYTEKVWGIPCSKIRSEWAEQRIKGLSIVSVVLNALLGFQKSKSLINEFYYPLEGPGMMWEGFKSAILSQGGQIRLNSEAVSLHHANGRIVNVLCCINENEIIEMPVSHLISSMPIDQLIARLDPQAPDNVLEAANKLDYRSFILVGLIIEKKSLFPDQWLYIQDPKIRVGRIQNFKNWSLAMVPDPQKTSLGMEYFCTDGDELWSMSDSELIRLATKELAGLGLAQYKDILNGFVIRQPDAYPIYDEDHNEHLRVVRDFLGTIENLQTIGRNGMHRYNNMDHSMYTGMLSAKNVLGERHDLWDFEETHPDVVRKDVVSQRAFEETVIQTFVRMDKLALAIAVGAVSGLFFFLLTVWLIVKGGDIVGPHLQLLGQYFIGYTVTLKGAFIALGYGFFWGFLFGGLFAFFRNFFMAYYVYRAKKKAELLSFRDFFDQL